MSGLHFEVLTSAGRAALDAHARAAREEGFHLAGGTALALQLGHRRSVDFDWFCAEPLSDPLGLARRLIGRGVPFVTASSERGTLHGTVLGVRVSFLEFRYPLLEPALVCELGFGLARARDIGAMKLAAVAQRGARKDFFDLAALGRAGFDLTNLLQAYRARFAVRDIAHVLTALTYFDDAEQDSEPILEAQEDWESVKRTVRSWVRAYAARE